MEDVHGLIKTTLENHGVLGRMRAQLRASVYTAIDAQERTAGVHLENKQLADIRATDRAATLYHLVDEYLNFFGLDFTRSCFHPETNADGVAHLPRDALAEQLGLQASTPGPLLLQVLADGGALSKMMAPVPTTPVPTTVPVTAPPALPGAPASRGPSPTGSSNGAVSPRSSTLTPSPATTPRPTPTSPRLPVDQLGGRPAGDGGGLGPLPPLGTAASMPLASLPRLPGMSPPAAAPSSAAPPAPEPTAPPTAVNTQDDPTEEPAEELEEELEELDEELDDYDDDGFDTE